MTNEQKKQWQEEFESLLQSNFPGFKFPKDCNGEYLEDFAKIRWNIFKAACQSMQAEIDEIKWAVKYAIAQQYQKYGMIEDEAIHFRQRKVFSILENMIEERIEPITIAKQEEKTKEANATIQYIKNFKKINIGGTFADDSIIQYVKENGGIIATIDKDLKYKIKNHGGSVISIANNRIVLEATKN